MREDDREHQDPKVTPWMLRAADTMCARRLHLEYTGAPGTADPVNRARVREALLDAVRTWHETGTFPPAPSHLEAEERRVVEHALGWYPRVFEHHGNEHLTVETPLGDPTELPRRGVRLGGWVDLCVVHADGSRELRQLALGARPPEDPLELPAVRLAVLRLAQTRWFESSSSELSPASSELNPSYLNVIWADLLTGVRREAVVRVPDDLEGLATWLDERLEVVDARILTPDAEPGRDCTTCRFVPRCPAHSMRGSMTTRRGDRFPGVLALSPTTVDAWHRCRRELGNRALAVPPSDLEGGTAHGLYLHNVLRFVHEHGSCHDDDHVADVLEAHGADERVAEEVRRHVSRCPSDAVSVGHELEWARANPTPPVFMASARLDAVWLVREQVLEIRDYKTGSRVVEVTADDTRAQLQAWVAAPYAAERGLRLRIRYEHLSREVDDDPAPWEPDADDLEKIEAQLRETVAEMHAERDWHGVADESICRYCRYRSICPDSATPSEPYWPMVSDVSVTPPAAAGRSRG